MTELIAQYGPYVFVVLAAIFLFVAGHHVGASTAATVQPEATKIVSPVVSKTTALNAGDATLEVARKPDAGAFSPTTFAQAVAFDPDGMLKLHADISAALVNAGHLASVPPAGNEAKVATLDTQDSVDRAKLPDAAEHSVLGGLGSVVSEENPAVAESAPKAAAKTPAETPAKSGIEAEVAKAHDALDKAGVYGPNRLIAIGAVRAGQITGDDVARAHPAAQVPQIAKAAE